MGLTLQTTKGVCLKKIRGCTLAVKKEIATYELHLIVLAPLSYHKVNFIPLIIRYAFCHSCKYYYSLLRNILVNVCILQIKELNLKCGRFYSCVVTTFSNRGRCSAVF